MTACYIINIYKEVDSLNESKKQEGALPSFLGLKRTDRSFATSPLRRPDTTEDRGRPSSRRSGEQPHPRPSSRTPGQEKRKMTRELNTAFATYPAQPAAKRRLCNRRCFTTDAPHNLIPMRISLCEIWGSGHLTWGLGFALAS